MKNIFRIFLTFLFVVALGIFYSWSVRTLEMSDGYITETASALIFGQEVQGTIEKISKNTKITISNNYLVTVSYTTLDNQKITREFRYSEEKIPLDTQVHVLYNRQNPLKAALKEDSQYFKYSCFGILAFIALFTILLSAIGFGIYRLGKIKLNTGS